MYSSSRDSQFLSLIKSLLGTLGQDKQEACPEWQAP